MTLIFSLDVAQDREKFGHNEPSEELIRWLSPRCHDCDHYKDDLYAGLSLRHPNTCEWIHNKENFKLWLSCQEHSRASLLWLHATPGTGKTVLSSYIINHLLSQDDFKDTRHGQEVFYFFFNNADNDKSTPLAAIRALVHQLLQSVQVQKRIKLIQELESIKRRSGQSRSMNFRPLWGYFTTHCTQLIRPIIVLDALDECEQVNVLISELCALAKYGSIRILVTSRREAEIIRSLEDTRNVAMDPEDVQNDIQAYLEYQLSQSSKLSHVLVRSRILRILSMRSKGMFLWVVLMLEELRCKQTILEMEDMLAQPLPRDLHGVYNHILLRLNSTLKSSQKALCQNILRWVALAKRPLQVSEVEEILKFEYENNHQDTLLIDSAHTVRELQVVCGSLISIRNQSIHLVHLSTREFLLSTKDADQSTEPFLIDLGCESPRVASTCISFISKRCTLEDRRPEKSGCPLIRTQKSFLQYACFNWLTHMSDSDRQTIALLHDSLVPFTTTRACLIWIEFCLSSETESISQLKMDIQSLAYWSTLEPQLELESLNKQRMARLKYWADCCLNLLTDYGLAIRDRPFEIHSIDPRLIFPPSEWRIDEDLSKNVTFGRHVFLTQNNTSHVRMDPLQYPAHRSLQKHTSIGPNYALFYLHEGNNAFISVDQSTVELPRLHCQHAVSGRRLLPVRDTEFLEESESVTVVTATKNKDGNYIGIIYHVGTRWEGTLYIAVWRVHEGLNFEELRPRSWAHKVLSLVVVGVGETNRIQPLVFDRHDSFYCPSGCFNLRDGVKERCFDRLRKAPFWDISFSGDGSTIMRCDSEGNQACKSLTIEILTSGNAWEEVVKFRRPTYGAFLAISNSGRFILCHTWDVPEDLSSEESRALVVFDTERRTSTELAKFEIQQTSTEAAFHNNDNLIICLFGERLHARTGRIATHIWVFRRAQTGYNMGAATSVKGRLAGHYFEESNQHLYLVSADRVWFRLDIGNKDPNFLDPLHEVSCDSSIWKVQQVSHDGHWLALLQENEGQ